MASGPQTQRGQMSTEVNILKYLHILKDLEDLITPSFGPCGHQVLIMTGTGSCMVSKDGKTILESYVSLHPIANWVVDHVRGHYRSSGDNSKSFILLFAELLRRVTACRHRQGPQGGEPSKVFCLEMAQSFALLASEALPSVLLSTVLTRPVLFSAQLTNSSEELEEFVSILIFSTLQGNLPQAVAKHLRRLAVDFIQLHLPLNELKDRTSFITENFSYLCQEVSGHSVTESHIVDGVLIPRDFAFCDGTPGKCDNRLRVLLIACDFVAEHTSSNTTITLSSVEQISQAAMSNRRRWSRLLTRLQDHNVDVLITVNIVPDPLLAMCRRSNISVIHSVCSEELSRISQRSGVPMMYDLEEDFNLLIHDARFIRRTILGKEVYSCVGFTSKVGQLLRHLVVCGPTATISRSYSASVQNALKALLHCLGTPVGLSPQLDKAVQGGDKDHSQPVQEWIENSERSKPVAVCQETPHAEWLENSGSFKPVQGGQEVNDRLYTVYGGGAMEQIMSNALHRFSNHTTDEQLRLAAAVFAEALEIIPRTLHNNSYQVDIRGYLSRKARTLQERDRCMGINARSGVWVPAAELGIVDPLGSKLTLWQSVLHSMCELLRIDSVLGVSGIGCRD